jgi:hypothetical protein
MLSQKKKKKPYITQFKGGLITSILDIGENMRQQKNACLPEISLQIS